MQYQYSAYGVPYTGSRLAYGYGGDSDRDAQELLYRKLQAASSVDVRFDPTDPATSVLSHGINRSLQSKLIFAVIWIVFAGGIGVLSWVTSQGDDVLLRNLSLH